MCNPSIAVSYFCIDITLRYTESYHYCLLLATSSPAMARPHTPLFLLLLVTFLALPIYSCSSAEANMTYSSLQVPNNSVGSIHALCHSTPYPAACLDSLKLSASIAIGTDPASILSLALRSLQAALSDAAKLTPLLSGARGPSLVESQRGSVQDCRELHQATVGSLTRSAALVNSGMRRILGDVRANLAAALTNKNTCLEGLSGAHGVLKVPLVSSWVTAYAHVSNSLSLVSRSAGGRRPNSKGRRRLLSSGKFPAWLGGKSRRILQGEDYGRGVNTASLVLTVSPDGTGNFTTISDAVAFAPNISSNKVIVMVRAGVYDENVEIPSYKTNIVLIGEGSDVTVIRGNRSVGDGWTTFRSATISTLLTAVSGQGFLARDIAFRNVAGPAKGQAVALRVNADLVAIYRCVIDGYQDTLYVHSFRQFYRECDIYGTVDFIFGNAAVVLQACNIVAKKPLRGQTNVVTAQSRDDPNEETGISIQNCTIVASDDLAWSNFTVRSFLGRPWRNYSRTAYIESYIDGLIDPTGWMPWSGDQGLATVYYGEYMNLGPGAGTERRVTWPGHRIMGRDEAAQFTVSEFIYGDEWLDSTSFPYDDGI